MADELTINLDGLRGADEWSVEYDESQDTLYVRANEARAATSIVLGEVWARIDPGTNETVGFEIEGFSSVFLRRHPEFSRPSVKASLSASEREAWLETFFDFLRRVERGSPGRRASA